MDKKALTIVGIILAVIVVLVCVVLGMQTQTASKELSSEEILRINDKVYSKDEFIKFVKYTLYKNDGEMTIDEEQYADQLESGTSKESLFISSTLNSFYQMKAFDILAEQKNIVISGDKITEIENDYNENEAKITAAGLTKEDFIDIEKQQAIISLVNGSPKEYLELPDEVYDNYISQYSGDDLKSYTYRMIQVGYTTDTENESGEMVSGDMAEKQAYMNDIVNNIKNGMPFEDAAESGDSRLIFIGNGIQVAKSIEEHSAGFLLEQKMGSKEISDATKKTASGDMTEVIDTGSAFQIAKVEGIEDGIVGEVKEEVIDLLISSAANELVYSVVDDMEVNNSAVSRIKIK